MSAYIVADALWLGEGNGMWGKAHLTQSPVLRLFSGEFFDLFQGGPSFQSK